ncbi:MAG: right-handed parallel beta-helix repeat-containing protein [Deltaproteobacteria bacterium]|nr:right-handed parallel beta-helix repeat-containing protein [Deltaproteobacteria bacterium]MBN2671999.1 right-handed parallel beta-helix repeat-containing protein [Deltaproteobacteria bacterium]
MSEIHEHDTGTETDVDTETESEGNEILWRDVMPGIDECAHLTPLFPSFEEDEIFIVGDGTPESCLETELREAVQQVNDNGRGRIEFRCGSAVHQILLTGPLVIDAGVQLSMDGGMNIVLDGREVFRIIVAQEASELFFERTIFMDGKADGANGGGAVFIDNQENSGRAIFSECVFKGNLSEQGSGGAIYAYRLSRLEIFRCVFQWNFSATGGALFYFGSDLQVANSDFYGNEVFQDGGAVVFVEDELGSDTDSEEKEFPFCGNRFSNNFSIGDGSGLKIVQGIGSTSVISYNEFLQNSTSEEFTPSDGAGVVNLRHGRLEMTSSSFVRNTSTSSVGGIYLNTDDGFEIVNCTFFLNTSEEGEGGAIYQRDTNPGVVRNCSFVRNSAREGGAIYKEDASSLAIDNSIFIDNLNGDDEPGACNTIFSGDHNFQWVHGYADLGTLCTPNTIHENAFLMSPAYNGGFVLTCRLDALSSARDVGENCPALDARGETRKVPCDAGAYEVVGE